MEPRKELTIRIHFGTGQKKPKDGEIFQFFRDHGWKYEELAAMYREDYSVYVKFQSMELMRKALLRLGPKTTFRYADGTTTETMVMDAGGVIKYVRIFGLAPEIEDGKVREEMDKYGKVKQLCREKYSAESGFPIWNGVRGVFMEVEKALPAQIKIQAMAARLYYDGLRDKCFGCGSEGHIKGNCPERSSATSSSLAEQRTSSFAQVVAIGSSASQPIKILDASSANNQAGKGRNRSNEQEKKPGNEKEVIVEECQTLAGSVEGNNVKENTNILAGTSSETNNCSGAKEIYRRPWPKYR